MASAIRPIPGTANGAIDQGRRNAGQAQQRVERGQGQHPVRLRHGPLAPDRPADVVDHQVAALDSERVHRLAESSWRFPTSCSRSSRADRRVRGPESRTPPPAIPARRAPGSPSGTGRSSSGTPCRRTTGAPSALFAHEARRHLRPQSGGLLPDEPRSPRVRRRGCRPSPHDRIGMPGWRDSARAPARLAPSVPLTRSREARKGREHQR